MSQLAILELRHARQQVVVDEHVIDRAEWAVFAAAHPLARQGLRVVQPLEHDAPERRMPFGIFTSLLQGAYAALRQLEISREGVAMDDHMRVEPIEHRWGIRDSDQSQFNLNVVSSNWPDLFESLQSTGRQGAEIVELDLALDAVGEMVSELEDASPQLRENFEAFPEGGATATPPREAPLPADATNSVERRALMLRGWLTGAQVAEQLGSRARSNMAQYAANLRRQGRLLGVWHGPDRAYLHPPCQFVEGRLIPQVAELLAILPGPSRSGWEQAEWLHTPHALLDAMRPADLLPKDPDRVVEAAREEYQDGIDASW